MKRELMILVEQWKEGRVPGGEDDGLLRTFSSLTMSMQAQSSMVRDKAYLPISTYWTISTFVSRAKSTIVGKMLGFWVSQIRYRYKSSVLNFTSRTCFLFEHESVFVLDMFPTPQEFFMSRKHGGTTFSPRRRKYRAGKGLLSTQVRYLHDIQLPRVSGYLWMLVFVF